MPRFRLLKLTFVVCFGVMLLALCMPSQAQSNQPVLVELFTSQGCPACPPADAFLSELKNLPNLIVVAWHVDYWDEKGIDDPFSDRSFSQRQITYAKAFQSERIYTPQMVVDGATCFNGSDRKQAKIAIRNASSRAKSRVFLVAHSVPNDPYAIEAMVRFEKHSDTEPDMLAGIILAVTEDNLSVTHGEGSPTKHHDAVVRWARVAGETSGNEFEKAVRIPLARSWKQDDLRLVAFVQGSESQRILASRSVAVGNVVESE